VILLEIVSNNVERSLGVVFDSDPASLTVK